VSTRLTARSDGDGDGDEENEFDDGDDYDDDDDEDEEVNLGGMSQTMLDLCDQVEVHGEEDDDVDEEPKQKAASPGAEERELAMAALRAAESSGAAYAEAMSRIDDASEDASDLSDVEAADEPNDSAIPEKKLEENSVRAMETVALSDVKESVANKDGHDTEGFDTQSPLMSQPAHTKAPAIAAPVAAKKASPRNVGIVGKTTNNIRSGVAGRTAFSALDLPLPGKKKKKKRSDAL